MKEFELSLHAKENLLKRDISEDWIQRVIESPEKVVVDADMDKNTHYIGRILENGNRFLRVIVNPHKAPKVIVTCFFDRRIK